MSRLPLRVRRSVLHRISLFDDSYRAHPSRTAQTLVSETSYHFSQEK